MKRWLKKIIPVFVLTFILLGPAMKVQAGTIVSLSATPGTGKITVSGVAGNDVLSVMILLYDSTETNILQMQSVAVDGSHAYQYTFNVEEGTYVVKVADYEGGAFESKTVTVTAPTTKYTVSVTADDNGRATASVTEAVAGTKITLTATPKEGYVFKAWEVVSGSITLADKNAASTTFVMPGSDVKVKATFVKDAAASDATKTPTDKTPVSQSNSTKSDGAKTGDNVALTALIIMLATSLLGFVTLLIKKRRINN